MIKTPLFSFTLMDSLKEISLKINYLLMLPEILDSIETTNTKYYKHQNSIPSFFLSFNINFHIYNLLQAIQENAGYTRSFYCS